eukprot:scaffold259139_cov40-Tisochrysis_lutea.AAC.1
MYEPKAPAPIWAQCSRAKAQRSAALASSSTVHPSPISPGPRRRRRQGKRGGLSAARPAPGRSQKGSLAPLR